MKKIIIALALLATMTVSAQPQGKPDMPPQNTSNNEQKKEKKKKEKTENVTTQRVYLYGVAMSMQDSVVYITDELILDNAVIHKKTKFLENRDMLSAQLEQHMTKKGEKNRLCSVTFATSVKTLDKKYLKQVEKLKKKGYLVKSVGQGEFRFTPIAQ